MTALVRGTDAGSNRVCCVADGATVPEPQMLADLVYEQVLEQMACAVDRTFVSNSSGVITHVAAAAALAVNNAPYP